MTFSEWLEAYDHDEYGGWSGISPDSVIHSYGDASKFTAFVWIYDKKTNQSILYCQPGSMYHAQGMDKYEPESKLVKALKFEGRQGAVACFGRFGETNVKGEQGGFVTIWRYDEDEYSSHYDQEYKKQMNRGYVQPNTNDIKLLLKGMLGQAPLKIIGKSPAKLPITPEYRFVVQGKVQTVGEFLGGVQQQEDPQDAKCRDLLKVNVQNRPTPLSDVQAQLHMVKGQARDLLRGAFCSQYQQLKNAAQSHGCPRHIQQIDDIEKGFQCGDDAGLYGSLLKQGKDAYKQQLRDIFRDPNKVGQYFRTQKDINAAWDYLRGEHYSFSNWLKTK